MSGEVKIPRSAYRADVAAATRRPASPFGRVAVFECKQSRSDLLRDCADESGTRERTRQLAERLAHLRELIGGHRPDLRRGETLFAEFDEFDFGGLRHDGLHSLEQNLESAQRKLLLSVKFARLHRYASADYLYLVTEPGVVSEPEVPVGWGWLVREGESLQLRVKPTRHLTEAALRVDWLERLASAGARATWKSFAV